MNKQLKQYILETYNCEQIMDEFFRNEVFWHSNNRKWFASSWMFRGRGQLRANRALGCCH